MGKVIKLIADWDSGEGSIARPKEWQIEYPLMKLDLLKDWIYILECEYKREIKEWRKELAITQSGKTK
jgi:hypothetical protein